jgi:hypothetical protein
MAACMIAVLLIVAAGPAVASAAAARAGASAADGPAGFWYGTDSWPMSVGGSGPFREPGIGGGYGGYMGMIGSWEWWLGCHGRFLAWSNTNSAQADANLSTYHEGVGTGAYWFMGGPGVDPRYNGSSGEAYAWGAAQAARALADIRRLPQSRRVSYRVVWMDIELPLISPAPDNGWDSVYTSSCSGVVKRSHVATAVDRAEFNGFWDYVSHHSSFRPGVYSAPADWSRIFGSGSAGGVPNTDGPISLRRQASGKRHRAGVWSVAPARASSAASPASARTR